MRHLLRRLFDALPVSRKTLRLQERRRRRKFLAMRQLVDVAREATEELHETTNRFHSLLEEWEAQLDILRLQQEALTAQQAQHDTQTMMLQAVLAQQQSLQMTMLAARAEMVRRDEPSAFEPVDLTPVESNYSLESCFNKLKQRVPKAFQLWHELLEVNARAYDGCPTHSCSVSGHRVAEILRRFLRPYLNGPVLDIGCGPQPIPAYLDGYPCELIAGIDPLAEGKAHPFTFVQGVAEFLPWNDATFTTVVAATSLDHVLLLDQSLAEVRRVLQPDGRFITWVGFVPGAAEYDPYSEDVCKIDDYHLFHFDRPWFEEAINREFEVDECFHVDAQSVFWVLRPRRDVARLASAA